MYKSYQVRIWDYQTKACVQVLEGHTHNVSSVLFHPRLPILISGSEDGTVRAPVCWVWLYNGAGGADRPPWACHLI
jgi:WD40 repeat protein